MQRMFRILSVCCVGFVPSFATMGSILPKIYTLTEGSDWHVYDDAALKKWLDEIASRPHVDDIDLAALPVYLKSEDAVVQAYIALRHSVIPSRRVDETTLKASLVALKEYADANHKSHYLLPYFLKELENSKDVAAADIGSLWRETDVRSCPAKYRMRKMLSDPNFVRNNPSVVNESVSHIKEIHDPRSVNAIVRGFLAFGTISQRVERAQKLLAANPDSEPIKRAIAGDKRFHVPVPNMDEYLLKSNISRERCKEARDEMLTLSKKNHFKAKGPYFEYLDQIALCFKPLGFNERMSVWDSFAPEAKRVFGSDGEIEIELKKAYLHWAYNRFAPARDILAKLSKWSEEQKLPRGTGYATLSLAKIDENQGFAKDAIARYEIFVKQFPNEDVTLDALASLVILQVGQGNWPEVHKSAEEMVAKLQVLPLDDRDIGNYGLGLFWSGRALLEMGQKDQAIEHWRRLVTECFSTYYGAIGHYLLEQVTQKSYVIQPYLQSAFDERMVKYAYKGDDATIVDRAMALLRLGLKEDAHCEIDELNAQVNNEEQVLSKAILFHLSGDWLASIKLYGALSRTYRSSLPYGMERLLYPRRYEVPVKLYSDKLKIDPELTMSLIRQESVFDPKALSPAGAQGLMQIRPQTAAGEINHLKSFYITSDLRGEIRHKAKASGTLFEPEINVVLGVNYLNRLIQRYNNPAVSLSAYNAGPATVDAWVKKYAPDEDWLYFIEQIPYKETRSYVKLILRNYFYYKKWYGPPGQQFTHLVFAKHATQANPTKVAH